jgi:serine protease Do
MTARYLAAAVALAAVAAPASAQISSNPKLMAPFKAVVAQAGESTVRIRGDDKDIALGTVVFADGYILTKFSELRGALSVRLTDGTEYEAKVHGVDRNTDLALLKVEVSDLKPVTFADSKRVPVGHWLAASGPTSDPLTVGIVSVRTRPLTGEDADKRVGNQNRGYLGVYPEDEKDKDGKVIGTRVTSVSPKGAAEKAGVKKNDIILEIDGIPVPGQTALRELLDGMRPGQVVTLKVLRDGEEKEIKATLTGNTGDKSRGDIQNAMGGELSGRRTGFPSVLQTDMVVEPKNCGGPVVDLDGNVLGISIARAGRVETWILPSEIIRPLLADLKSGKLAPVSAPKPETPSTPAPSAPEPRSKGGN